VHIIFVGENLAGSKKIGPQTELFDFITSSIEEATRHRTGLDLV
jgi:hypothetical protein